MNKTKRPMPPAAEKKTNGDQQNLYKKYRIPAVLILPALAAGLTAALLATVMMGLLRGYAGVPTPVERTFLKILTLTRLYDSCSHLPRIQRRGRLGWRWRG
ncbi:MAG: hypothetical protein IMW89_15370 [Ktedonobacteraceae bacterium]|nr:hypothetical protein [Ktedonobacteraceae bacterium]